MINIQKMSQLYTTLIRSHVVANAADNEIELFSQICKDILNISEIKMVWIGVIDEVSKELQPLGSCGEGTEYLQDVHIDVNTDTPLGNGPSGIAYREDAPYWCQDFLNDPHCSVWHEQARKFGWRSSAAIPIHKHGRVIGTLNLYSNQLGIFDEQARILLQNMVLNMDYTLAGFENEKARKKVEDDLMESYNLLTTIINAVPGRLFWKDKNLTYLGCNLAFARDAGKSSPEDIVGTTDYQMPWKNQVELYTLDDRRVLDSKTPKLSFEEPQTAPNGDTIWVRTSKVPLFNSKKETVGILGIYDDITEQKLSEDALRESQQKLQTIIDNEPECVKLINPRGQLIEMNPAGLAMLEAESLEVAQKKTLLSYLIPQWRVPFLDLHKRVMSGKSGMLEFEIRGLKGTQRWLETHAVPLRDSLGNVTMLLGITRDITEHKKTQQKIEFMANYDALTGLPNRLKLEEQLEYLVALSKREDWNFALMFLDIDHFKDINDTLGHTVGDKLLKKFAQRIKNTFREEDTLARFGGDEFIILLPNTNALEAQQVAQKLLATAQLPFSIEHHKLAISASIGIAIYPMDGVDKDTLYKNADTAMYRAKHNGRNNYSFFTKEMQIIAKRNLELNNALYDALSNNELHLVYQPQISATTGKVIGAEALLRWTHPTFGNVSPAEFIPIAENNGLILPIGEWVLETAIGQMKEWLEKGMLSMVMAVNLSAVQFRNANLPDVITKILDEVGLPAQYLEIELTEGVTMNNPHAAINIMNHLDQIGIKMSIDDFGIGYSSLSYLKKFKVYKLKIDQSFVRDITTDPEDKAIVAAIINMAQSLGLQTIAEGVETLEQLNYLCEQGCDEIQGYYYSRPLLAQDFEQNYM